MHKILVAAMASLVTFVTSPHAAERVVVSTKASGPIVLDGVADKAWEGAKALNVTLDRLPYEPNNGYPGMKRTDVSIKSLYDDNYLYLLISYQDPSKSLARLPWVKKADGSWAQLANSDSTGHENTYYEDKLALLWDISTKGFATDGCLIACHLNEPGDSSPGRKYTASPGETIDMWQAEYVRTMPMGQFDDQYIDNNKDPKANEDWGRKNDSAPKFGGYKTNETADKKGPAFMNLHADADDQYYVIPSKKIPFVDTFKEGAVVPGIEIAPLAGGRADILARSTYENGTWTIEVMRALKTEGENAETQDVQFTDKGKSYPFGIAVFDNTEINHLYHELPLELKYQ